MGKRAQESFFKKDGKMEIAFQEYAVSSHASGPITVTFEAGEIKDWIKPDHPFWQANGPEIVESSKFKSEFVLEPGETVKALEAYDS